MDDYKASKMSTITKVSLSTHTRKWSNLKCGYFAPKLTFPQFEISQEFLNKKMSHLSLKTYFLTAKIEKVRFLLTRESSSVNKNLTLLLLQLENRFKNVISEKNYVLSFACKIWPLSRVSRNLTFSIFGVRKWV